MKKIKSLLAIVAMFSIVLTVVACSNTANAEEAYVTIDINPSVELIVNGNDQVVYANALNEDAEVLLADLDLVGMDVEEATDFIIETAIELGYIDLDAADTVVSVSSTSDTGLGEQIKTRVKEAVNNAFQNRGLNGHSEDKGFSPEFIAEAESYGVTPGFLFLAKAVVTVQDETTLEVALEMTQEELRDILKDAKDAAKEVLMELRDDFIAARQLVHDEYDPQIETLETTIANLENQMSDVEAQIEVESTPELVAQLEALQADLEEAQTSLQTLVDDMHAEIALLRTDFHTQSEALYPQLMARVETRRNQFMTRMEQWVENHPDHPMVDRFNDWKDNRRGQENDKS